jgi:hypothetical protein
MPIHYTIDSRLSIIREAFSGTATGEELRDHWTRLVRDAEAMALRATLADLRGATLDFDGQHMRRLLETVVDPGLQGLDWITAIIVGEGDQLGLARQYQHLADHYSHDCIFFSEQEALGWLMRERAARRSRADLQGTPAD